MSFSIEKFKSNALKYGGARPNLFDVEITFPFDATIKSSWHAKSTFLPSTITSSLNVNYLGRNFKQPGERTYPQWTVTFINDEDFQLRNALEKWMDHLTGVDKIGMTNIDAWITYDLFPKEIPYFGTAVAKQYSKNGNVLKAYKFHYIYPVTLTDISMSWDSIGQIEEYSCTFDYQYFKTSYRNIDPDVDKNLDQDYYQTVSSN